MLGDDLADALVELRAEAESRMGETVTIERLTGAVTTDPDTGELVDERVTIYPAAPGGKDIARVHGDRAYEREHNLGAAILAEQRYFTSVPWDSGPYAVGDVVTVTASRHQPNLIGRQYRIAGRDERGAQTAQRMYVDIVA